MEKKWLSGSIGKIASDRCRCGGNVQASEKASNVCLCKGRPVYGTESGKRNLIIKYAFCMCGAPMLARNTFDPISRNNYAVCSHVADGGGSGRCSGFLSTS